MNKQRIELLPGVFLTVLHTDKFKTNCLSLNLLRPLCREEASLNALLPDVLLRGCKMCPDMGAISRWLDERYGAGAQALARKMGEVQAIGFFLDYIDEDFVQSEEHLTEDICRILGSFLMEPVTENGVFRRDYVESERANLINAIMSQINDKRTYAMTRLRETMFEGENFGVSKYGKREDVESITPESLYAHYRRVLETSRIEIIFTGKTDVERLCGYLLAALKDLPRGELTPVSTTAGRIPDHVREAVDSMDLTQAQLTMGFRTGITGKSEDYPAMLLMNGIFGGGINSKLFMNVREKLSLCYYASSGMDRFKGIMLVSSGVDMDKLETAREEILRQLEACRRGEITEEELESTRSYLQSALKTNEDSPYNMDEFWLGQQVGGFTYTPSELSEKLGLVTLEQIQRMACNVTLDTIYILKGGAGNGEA
ncbi:MAG: pitrilysin family protein [Oscillospiraceae bacterium]|nr:pitrilysin family protein [Oscillospiraceae bacterium]